MTTTTLVNIFYQTDYDYIYIGRGSPFGNPYKVTAKLIREKAVEKYKKYFYEKLENDARFKQKVLALKGCRLGCFCKPLPCHGDVIIEYLEGGNGN